MTESVVLIESPAPGVGLVRINRPDARNALNMEVRKSLVKALADLTENESIRAIVLTGSPKTFAAGADIKEMAGVGSIEQMKRGSDKLWRAIYSCPKPVIAAVTGFALGGGCELAMTCDIIIAGEGAKFGQPEVKIGIIPGGGGTQRLTRAIGKYKAMRYILTGDVFTAKEAFDMGLVSELAADADVEKRAVAMAQQLAELPPLALMHAKESVLASMETPLSSGLAFETKAIQILFSSQDQKEGMAAFIEKRKPNFVGK
ncbi:MAG: Enoyl-CoA hydratase [Betaproteobacteria bacterium]|nr:Enoyl-CoA hydratase [Betaproteobacteria bacterium]